MMKFWQAVKTPLLTALFVLLGMFLYVNFSGALPFGYHKTSNTQFTADGTGEETYTPDTSLLYLSVEKTATTQDEAKSEANKVINQITADLKKLGIEEKNIKTTNFSVNQNYTTEAAPEGKMMLMPVNQNKPNGYIANASLEVRVKPLSKAEQAIDIATKDGATQVGTSQMVVDDSTQKDLESKARLQAIKNAKEKAQELANAAGIHLGRVVSIQENNGGGIVRPMLMKTDMASGSLQAAPTQLNPGENTISVSVTLSFETY